MWHYMHQGGPLMWPLLACSIIALALVVERLLVFVQRREREPRLARQISDLLATGDLPALRQACQSARGPLAQVFGDCLQVAERGSEAIEARFEASILRWREVMTRNLRALAVIAQITPLIGLLGTITGMVAAFRSVEQAAFLADPSVLAGGIWEALLTTVFGLAIAIPTSVAYHVFEDRVDRNEQRMHKAVHELIARVTGGEPGGS